jgi:hypothetical protein
MKNLFLDVLTETASQALCRDAKCAAVIVSEGGEVIGRGYNGPPLDKEENKKCDMVDMLTPKDKPKYDRTCCVHAEWRAIMDACKMNPDKVVGATLYFLRLGPPKPRLTPGRPFCTVCSRLALDVGLLRFALWRGEEFEFYDTKTYNDESYKYFA